MTDSNGSNIPTWVPPGQHDRPKPGSAEARAEEDRASAEGREPWAAESRSPQPSRGPAVSGQPSSGGRPGWPLTQGGRGAGPQGRSAQSPGLTQEQRAGEGLIGGPVGGPPGDKKKSRLKIAVWVLVGVTAAGSIVYGVYLGFLWFLGWTATQVPRSWEVELGRSAASDILSKAEVCTDPRLNRYMGKMADRLEKAIDEKPYDFRFKVVDRKSVNAFALPGGYVFVHSGLLRKAESGSEVAGVLAHEMQHVLKRHGMRRVVRKLGFWFALQLIFGNAGGLGDLLAQGAVKLGSLKYDRGQEDEADMEGVKQLYRAGMDPRGLPRFFKRLAKREEKRSSTEKALLPLLSSHPPSSYRQKRIMGYIKKRGLPENLRELKGYAEVKDLCEPKSFNKPDVDPPGMDGSGTTEKPAGRESAEPETPAARPRKARQ